MHDMLCGSTQCDIPNDRVFVTKLRSFESNFRIQRIAKILPMFVYLNQIVQNKFRSDSTELECVIVKLFVCKMELEINGNYMIANVLFV